MDQPQITPAIDYSVSYYDPPRVKWWVLFLLLVAANITISLATPNYLSEFLQSLLFEIWGIYLCIFLRRLNPQSKSLYWLLAAIVANCSGIILEVTVAPESPLSYVAAITQLAGFGFYITAIYVMRAELTRHYREQEQFPMTLGPFMTFFFSYIYFQYHLYDIAQYKHDQRTRINTAFTG